MAPLLKRLVDVVRQVVKELSGHRGVEGICECHLDFIGDLALMLS